MNHLKRQTAFVTILVALLVWANPLMAQQYRLDVDKPEFDDILSPDVQANTTIKKWKPKDWLEVELKFKIESSDKNEDFADRVTVRWYVAASVTEGGKARIRILEKEVSYVNVPIDEDVYVSVYLSPSAVKRISGGDNAGKNVVEGVGGEITVNGTQPVKSSGFFTTEAKSKGKWWDDLPRYNKIPLRNKNETPFKFFWWDRYAEIEERR